MNKESTSLTVNDGWEGIITDADYDTFFQLSKFDDINDRGTQLHGTEPMPKNNLHFVYRYTLCCGDRKKLVVWLSDKERQADSESCVQEDNTF